MKSVCITILLLVFALIIAHGQVVVKINQYSYEADKSIGLVAGVSGLNSTDMELGLGLNFAEIRHISPHFPKPFLGFSISANYNPTNSDLFGQSFTAWFSGIYTIGLAKHYYREKELQTNTIKPLFGIEIWGITLTYGRNLFLNENQIEEISKNVFTVRYYLPIKIFM